jgi:putative transposase
VNGRHGAAIHAIRSRLPVPRGYLSIRYTDRLAKAGINPSVGTRGDSYDNALAKTINGLYKAELIHRRAPWDTRQAVKLASMQWLHWFNHSRLLEPIEHVPPAEAEAHNHRQLASETTVAVRLRPDGLHGIRGGSGHDRWTGPEFP